MPFQTLAAPFTIGDVDAFPAQVPCHGEMVSGDGLFVETGRTDGRLLVLLVDVMGHGVSANQTVSVIENQLLPQAACADLRPGDLLTTLNIILQPVYATTGRFVTALALLLDGQNGALLGGNASQPEPQLGQPGGAWQPWHLPNGPPLGILLLEGGYQDDAITLTSGQQLLVFTDGVTEAGAMQGTQFQHGSLQRCLARLSPGLPADQVVAQLVQAVQAHVPVGWPDDDTTVLCLQRR
jgi:sigma-B regulation protein RsbU (phosphoserine phosphatase)